MLPKRYHGWMLLFILTFLSGWLPAAHSSAAPGSPQGTSDPTEPPLVQLTVPPVSDAHRPSLTLHLDVAPSPLILGQTAVVTLTVANGAPDPADELTVTLPTPDGARALPGPNTVSPTQGWHWSVGHLDGRSSTVLTADLRLVRMPPGEALLLYPEATVRGTVRPIQATGGALVADRSRGPSSAHYRPGATAHLRSADGHVQVELPPGAADRPLTLRHAATPRAGNAPPHTGLRRGLGAFFLEAEDDQGNALHQFSAPLTVTVEYTPQQLEALGIAERDLRLSWFDETQQRWTVLPTRLDPQAGSASAVVDHFSGFQLSDGASPSEAFIPSLQGWQVGLFTGAATYAYPLDLPSGPGGVKPQLQLSYNSSATDGSGGLRPKQQASWVGKGWSLDTGAVARRELGSNGSGEANTNYFTLTLNGQSFDLTRGEALPGNTGSSDPDPTHWAWRSTDENFIRARIVTNGVSTDTHGARDVLANRYEPLHKWQVWTKHGTLYEFSEDLWWGWESCDGAGFGFGYTEAYKWLLSRVEDSHGNIISYQYTHDTWNGFGFCTFANGNYIYSINLTVDRDAWPTSITWGRNENVAGSVDRYKVEFVSTTRPDGYDTAWDDGADAQFGFRDGQPRETRMLQAVRVWSLPASSWQIVREYQFDFIDYADTAHLLYSDAYRCASNCDDKTGTGFSANTSYPKLTLKSITRVGAYTLGQATLPALPPTSFSYQLARGPYKRANGGWNRIQSVNNGQGGTVSFSYAHIAQVYLDRDPACSACFYNLFLNYHRVTSKTVNDGRGHSYPWNYAYGEAAVNSLGSTIDAHLGPNQYPTSARVYYSYRANELDMLIHRQNDEFRGHAWTIETGPTGAQTRHFFYQGDAGCTPATFSESDSCFVLLRTREVLKGRESLTQLWSAPGGTRLQETQHSFGVTFYDYGQDPRNGLWHAFSAESRTDVRTFDPVNPNLAPSVSTTTYTYDLSENSNSNGGIYGNLSKQELFDTDGNRTRIARHYYAIHDTATVPAAGSPYIVDRAWADYTWDGSSHSLAYTAYFYDNGSTQASIGASGNLTRQSSFYDLPSATSPSSLLHSRDVTYSYDSYGNRLTERTYAQAGTAQLSGSSWSFSAPGSGSTARTTSTSYDTTFHAFATQQTNPLNQSTRADYDYRMGTLLRVTGPNTTATPTACGASNTYSLPIGEESNCAQYDVFGRLLKLVKPGDTSGFPTVQATYDDTAQPLRYRIDRRETAATAQVRSEQQFYDGLGRKIQTKSESLNGTQNIVLDTRYDGLGRVTATSQARYVSETAASFIQYTNPGTGALYNQTTTSYDSLGRVLDVQGPDTAIPPTRTRYSLGSLGLIAATTDSNSHKVERETDEFGRLRQVREYSGNSSYVLYAATGYGYDALDQLTRVTDAGSPAGNVTLLTYDSLGRKTSSDDSDMGLWSYSYDANGNLLTQTDAKGQVLWFGYDALDRLTQKRQTSSSGTLLASYGYDVGSYGKGRRTSMSVPGGAITGWLYDARGRKTLAAHTVPGLSSTRVFAWSYDSADRLTTLTYPVVGSSSEVITTTYDAAWRPTSACTSLGGCYVQNAQYTALDQPDRWTLGNNLIQNWSYSGPLQRLSQLQVGNSSSAGSAFDRTYSYDNVGNVKTVADNRGVQTQRFDYDDLDRLTHAWTTGSATASYDETYAYNAIGNLTNKDGVVYTYPASGSNSVRPHTPSSVGGTSYVYDADGNLTSGAGRSYTWTLDNLLASVSQTSGSESYSYDADGERVKVVRGSTTTVYLEGVWEEVAGAAARSYVVFNGQVVAVRDRTTNVVTYLHGDHLGSVSVATTSAGAPTVQEYTPFGSHRGTGDITQTTLDYTGQRMDSTGLLYYHARYYDPALGRFVSPDTIVPGADALTIGPGKQSGGPDNPQNLNRYTYVNNNPINKTDATGHCPWCIGALVGAAVGFGVYAYTHQDNFSWQSAALWTLGGAVAGGTLGAATGYAAGLIAAGEATAAVSAGSVAVAETSTAVTMAACADGDCGNEVSATASIAERVVEAASADGDPTNEVTSFSRALTHADLGIKGSLQQLEGTFSVAEETATVRIDMIEGRINNPLQVLRSLSDTARATGASKLRIEAYLAYPRLNDILIHRYGMQPGAGPNGMDIIEIMLR